MACLKLPLVSLVEKEVYTIVWLSLSYVRLTLSDFQNIDFDSLKISLGSSSLAAATSTVLILPVCLQATDIFDGSEIDKFALTC